MWISVLIALASLVAAMWTYISDRLEEKKDPLHSHSWVILALSALVCIMSSVNAYRQQVRETQTDQLDSTRFDKSIATLYLITDSLRTVLEQQRVQRDETCKQFGTSMDSLHDVSDGLLAITKQLSHVQDGLRAQAANESKHYRDNIGTLQDVVKHVGVANQQLEEMNFPVENAVLQVSYRAKRDWRFKEDMQEARIAYPIAVERDSVYFTIDSIVLDSMNRVLCYLYDDYIDLNLDVRIEKDSATDIYRSRGLRYETKSYPSKAWFAVQDTTVLVVLTFNTWFYYDDIYAASKPSIRHFDKAYAIITSSIDDPIPNIGAELQFTNGYSLMLYDVKRTWIHGYKEAYVQYIDSLNKYLFYNKGWR